jgi:hypothetical protein
MNALQLLTDGAGHAARAVALLLSLPLAAQADPTARPPRAPAAHELRVVDAVFEVRVLGRLADLRVVEALRNNGTAPLDLGAHLAAASEDAAIDSLALTRDGRTVDLLAPLGGCGDEESEQASRTVAALDESIADVTQLAPGEYAALDTVAHATLEPAGAAWRLPLPAMLAPLAAQARDASGPDGPALMIVTPNAAAGEGRLTLRPLGRAARSVELGTVVPGSALIVPLDDATTLADLSAGAVELEIADGSQVMWLTLPLVTAARPTLARVD